MEFKDIAKETAKTLRNYLTYQAVRLISQQLGETNPGQAIWLGNFSKTHSVQDSDRYLEAMMSENKEIVLRILTVREDLAGEVLEFLPEMVLTQIKQSNADHRRSLLERLTRVDLSSTDPASTDVEPDVSEDSE
ncbi:chaperonin family protein RbcX [[Leptolyngbya] sp. PCC 7376]|uniref:chaperonin family protein RbcX n=1 Tax=[Leptolyngbya] sp. PCC 7376 TaxID=111781 RepID=UPI00029F27BF|nr:chaperonin family protein RbcX [[Leptolyngbya] sp. PCC 7376]AFY36624.1 chaperonin family protein RbcX [[Leptolyngbya] sp. PCC 7376]